MANSSDNSSAAVLEPERPAEDPQPQADNRPKGQPGTLPPILIGWKFRGGVFIKHFQADGVARDVSDRIIKVKKNDFIEIYGDGLFNYGNNVYLRFKGADFNPNNLHYTDGKISFNIPDFERYLSGGEKFSLIFVSNKHPELSARLKNIFEYRTEKQQEEEKKKKQAGGQSEEDKRSGVGKGLAAKVDPTLMMMGALRETLTALGQAAAGKGQAGGKTDKGILKSGAGVSLTGAGGSKLAGEKQSGDDVDDNYDHLEKGEADADAHFDIETTRQAGELLGEFLNKHEVDFLRDVTTKQKVLEALKTGNFSRLNEAEVEALERFLSVPVQGLSGDEEVQMQTAQRLAALRLESAFTARNFNKIAGHIEENRQALVESGVPPEVLTEVSTGLKNGDISGLSQQARGALQGQIARSIVLKTAPREAAGGPLSIRAEIEAGLQSGDLSAISPQAQEELEATLKVMAEGGDEQSPETTAAAQLALTLIEEAKLEGQADDVRADAKQIINAELEKELSNPQTAKALPTGAGDRDKFIGGLRAAIERDYWNKFALENPEAAEQLKNHVPQIAEALARAEGQKPSRPSQQPSGAAIKPAASGQAPQMPSGQADSGSARADLSQSAQPGGKEKAKVANEERLAQESKGHEQPQGGQSLPGVAAKPPARPLPRPPSEVMGQLDALKKNDRALRLKTQVAPTRPQANKNQIGGIADTVKGNLRDTAKLSGLGAGDKTVNLEAKDKADRTLEFDKNKTAKSDSTTPETKKASESLTSSGAVSSPVDMPIDVGSEAGQKADQQGREGGEPRQGEDREEKDEPEDEEQAEQSPVPARQAAESELKSAAVKKAVDELNMVINGFLTKVCIGIWVSAIETVGLTLLAGALAGDLLWFFKKPLINYFIKRSPLIKSLVKVVIKADDVADRIQFSRAVKINIMAMNAAVAVILFAAIFFFGVVLYVGCNSPSEYASRNSGYRASFLGLAGYAQVCQGFMQFSQGLSGALGGSNVPPPQTPVSSGGKCQPQTSGPASVGQLSTTCFGSNATKMSIIASVESGGGNPLAESSSDKCKDGNSWSIGIFQINMIAHGKNIGGVCGNVSSIFQIINSDGKHPQGDCLKRNSTNNVCVQYNCQVINQPLYNACKNYLFDASNNINYSCKISGNGANVRPWAYTANLCGVN